MSSSEQAGVPPVADSVSAGRAAARSPAPHCEVARRHWLASIASLGLLAGLSGLGACGFELRQPPRLRFASISLQGFAPRSPLARALQHQLALQLHVLVAPDQADVVLQALDEVRDKVVVASTAAAQVREFTLRLKFVFRAHTPAGRELIPRAELQLTRDMSYSENFALAKEQEEADLDADMESDVVTQVLRRLAAIKL